MCKSVWKIELPATLATIEDCMFLFIDKAKRMYPEDRDRLQQIESAGIDVIADLSEYLSNPTNPERT